MDAAHTKDNHENAPTQTGIVFCSALEALDIERRPGPTKRL
jgi:hypothetical protein